MMTRAYNELYLSNAMDSLADMFDYLINDCMLKADFAASVFVTSGYAARFEAGDPGILAGMSGVELGRRVIQKAYDKTDAPKEHFREERTPQYWAGWSLAQYQWFYGKRFKDIFERVPMSKILEMYPLHHEMDISQFNDTMDKFYDEAALETKLKRIRESRGVSQRELADLSGVNKRSIQMYEQRVNDIDKAQAASLYKISKILGCNIEDLLENPMK